MAGEESTQPSVTKDHFNFPVRVVFVNRKGLKFEQTLESLKAH